MQETKINGQTIPDQLKTKRNLLFEKFLENPSNARLLNEIRLIDDQIADLARHPMPEQKSEPV